MRFSVVEIGYDQRQVDACLEELAAGLTRLAAYAEGATEPGGDWEQVRRETTMLRETLAVEASSRPTPIRRAPGGGTREVVETLARARAELQSAREEARAIRERAYAEALQARRDFEAALEVRRRRQERVDEILSRTSVGRVSPETVTAAAVAPTGGVPVTRSAVIAGDDLAAEPATDRVR